MLNYPKMLVSLSSEMTKQFFSIMTYRTVLAAAALFTVAFTSSAKDGSYKVVSPDGHLSATVVVGKTIS